MSTDLRSRTKRIGFGVKRANHRRYFVTEPIPIETSKRNGVVSIYFRKRALAISINWLLFKPEHNGASDNPCSDRFAGHHAESEPEIAQFTKFYETIATSVKLYISFHSYRQKILTPFGHSNMRPENHDDIMDIALKGRAAIFLRNGREYEAGTIADVMCKLSIFDVIGLNVNDWRLCSRTQILRPVPALTGCTVLED